jgi:hypothetical protein
VEEPEKGEGNRSASLDGIYETVSSAERSSDNLIRQRIRLVGDLREEYFEENGDLIIERELFSGELSKLANISFETNQCLQTFQKNAIISERNNQKKQTPFQLELLVAALHLTAHPLQSEEERKFEQLRPLLKQWANLATSPALPDLAKEMHFLEGLREEGDGLEEVERKL